MAKKYGDHYQYSGAVHMHTTESDGTRSLEEVVAIGQEAGLDFMMFTDHMNLNNREAGKEGLYGHTLVVIGYEHNDLEDNHHYLVFGSPHVYSKDMTAAEYVQAAAKDGALGILAHPDEVRPREGRYRPYPWIDWTPTGFTGIELWNQMSEWMEKLTAWNRIAMAFSPRKSMVGPPVSLLQKWDRLNRQRKVVGVFSVDAHAFRVKAGPLTVEIFPYKVHFRTLRTHILLERTMAEDFDEARNQLYAALRDCRVFGSNMRWGKADGFQFTADNSSERAVIGGALSSVENSTLHVNLPSSATVKLIGNGRTILQTHTRELEFCPREAGIYRVEAWKGWRGWVFSNHIRIGG